MSERKGHGNRGSLMDLAKPRLAQSPLSAPIAEAERLILFRGAEPTTPKPDLPARSVDHQPPMNQASLAPTPTEVEDPLQSVTTLHPPAERIQSRNTQQPTSSPEDVLAKLRKTREPIAVVGFKLPARLKDELSAVAQYNSTDMTRIVVEALERFLSALPHPPGWER